jgi:hypothetical protein
MIASQKSYKDNIYKQDEAITSILHGWVLPSHTGV